MASSEKERRYRGPRVKEAPVMGPQFDENGNQTRASMLYGRIDSGYLLRLIMERKAQMAPYLAEKKRLEKIDKAAAKKLPMPVMSDRLAEAVKIIIKKTLGLRRWRKYSDTWKEAMFGHAVCLNIKYAHNFDPVKLATRGKNNDPYFYLGMIVWNAFNQQWDKLDKQERRIKYIPLNEGIYHGVVAMDQYAGVLEREEKRKAEQKKADIPLEGHGLDETVDIIAELDEASRIRIEDAEPGVDISKLKEMEDDGPEIADN